MNGAETLPRTERPRAVEPAPYSAGDLVQLKSGSPVMTVAMTPNSQDGRGNWDISVTWFSAEKDMIVAATVKAAALEPASKPKVTSQPAK